MNQSIRVRIILFLLLCSLVVLFTYIASIFTLLLGVQAFYIPLIIVIALGFLFYVFNGFFPLLKGKMLRRTVFGFIIVVILAVVVYETISAYDRGIPTVSSGEVDLYEYQPFAKESKAVELDEPIRFKMEGEIPIIDGATALYPIYAALAQATYPEKDYDVYDSEVMSNRTPDAYDNLINGKVDMIFALAPSDEQINHAKNKGLEFNLTPIGKEAFVFFVNSKNEVSDLTLKQIKNIYSGEITNWKDVGGANDSIRAFQRPADSGSQTTLEKLMGDTPIMEAPSVDIVSLMGGIIEETADYKNYKNAIGYTFRFYSNKMVQNNAIRHLAIDGVLPTVETIRSGDYPITSEFYVVTAGSENPNIEPFIEWILSEQGQSIIEKTGYVPYTNPLEELSVEEKYPIIKDNVYRVFLKESFELKSKNSSANVLKREYMVIDGKKDNYYPYIETTAVDDSIEDIDEARKYLLETDELALRLPSNTIVNSQVMEQWLSEGYEPINEYWDESPVGLLTEDID
ncbi:substrate-binding domain-containing protein [Paucisalibacillus globulus]|uniref:substrate-binding domain-containing protein n=1 Tax=Paucisalibacillus globulus TaxID=351095 RepID=UPI0004189B7A